MMLHVPIRERACDNVYLAWITCCVHPSPGWAGGLAVAVLGVCLACVPLLYPFEMDLHPLNTGRFLEMYM